MTILFLCSSKTELERWSKTIQNLLSKGHKVPTLISGKETTLTREDLAHFLGKRKSTVLHLLFTEKAFSFHGINSTVVQLTGMTEEKIEATVKEYEPLAA